MPARGEDRLHLSALSEETVTLRKLPAAGVAQSPSLSSVKDPYCVPAVLQHHARCFLPMPDKRPCCALQLPPHNLLEPVARGYLQRPPLQRTVPDTEACVVGPVTDAQQHCWQYPYSHLDPGSYLTL